MSTIDRNIETYYKIDPATKWRTYDVDSLENKELCQVVASKCTSDARLERLKGIIKGSMAVGTCLFLAAVAYAVAKVSALIVGVAALPLAVVPPLHALVMFVSFVGAGSAFGYYTIRSVWNKTMGEAKAHWHYSEHLYQQAANANTRKALFA